MNNSVLITLFCFVSLRSVQLLDFLVFPHRYVKVPSTITGQGMFYEALLKRPDTFTQCGTMFKVVNRFKALIPTSIT